MGKDTKFYLNTLKSEECQCGRHKKAKLSFCRTCYYALPPQIRLSLYRRIGNGYEDAYEEAVSWLN